MLPRDLRPDQFQSYAPEARKLAVEGLSALRRLPLSFLPNLLRELIEYDYKFPAERAALEKELVNLANLSDSQIEDLLGGFFKITLSPKLERSDWVNSPARFVEQLSADLRTTRQLHDVRTAATKYADHLRAVTAAEPPPIPRLGITVIGEGVTSWEMPLFRKLRPYGTYFSRVKPENGLRLLCEAAGARTKAYPDQYGHWYVDGAEPVDHDPALTTISYDALRPTREALLDRKLFSTSFVQWTAREVLHRAQPLTLLVRFAPRQRQKPMNELLSASPNRPELDVVGSLMDADMGAYYNWLNQQRLPGAEKSCFLVWFEGHDSAFAIGPSIPRQTESESDADLAKLLGWLL